MMKRLFAFLLAAVTLLSLTACGSNPSTSGKVPEENFVIIKESPDKYTWYIKNYVGKNCASFGENYSDRYRFEEYGEAKVKFIFIAEDNSFVDPVDKECLKQYVVTAQNIAPNTELKLTFAKNSDGTESDYSIEKQNIEEIELYVKRIADISDPTD